MSDTAKLLIGLIAGLVVGIAIALSGSTALMRVAIVIEPIGTVFINAIRMTVVPLVVSTLIVGIATTSDTGAIGRIGWRALVLFLAMVTIAALISAVVAKALFSGLTIDPAATARLQESVAGSAAQATENARRIPGISQWLVDLVPVNPVKAAADGAMLPLIVFTLAFGIALVRLSASVRAPAVQFFRAISDAMLLLVRWILVLAPIGVFALAVPLAARLGLDAARAIGWYLVVSNGLQLVAIAAMYPLVRAVTGIPMRAFGQALAPAQGIAFSARSSLAALPTMIERAETVLRLPAALRTFFLPLAASVFRLGSSVGITVGVLFIAALYGVPISTTALLTIVATTAVTTFSVPGVPAGSIVAMVPVLLAANVPVAGIGVLLAVDAIADSFRTTANVTGTFAAATLLARVAPDAQRTPPPAVATT